MLTLTWGTDILFGKPRPETGGGLKNTFCTMLPYLGISCKAGLVIGGDRPW